jgi:hypothetical protein
MVATLKIDGSLMLTRSSFFPGDAIANTIWATRAWTYQEALFQKDDWFSQRMDFILNAEMVASLNSKAFLQKRSCSAPALQAIPTSYGQGRITGNPEYLALPKSL